MPTFSELKFHTPGIFIKLEKVNCARITKEDELSDKFVAIRFSRWIAWVADLEARITLSMNNQVLKEYSTYHDHRIFGNSIIDSITRARELAKENNVTIDSPVYYEVVVQIYKTPCIPYPAATDGSSGTKQVCRIPQSWVLDNENVDKCVNLEGDEHYDNIYKLEYFKKTTETVKAWSSRWTEEQNAQAIKFISELKDQEIVYPAGI